MQLSIYYTEEDGDMIKTIETEAKIQRRSKSALILSILEKYYKKKRKLGKILSDIAFLSDEQIRRALEIQKKEKKRRLLGEILLDEGFIEEKQLRESLFLQRDYKKTSLL